MQFTVLSTLCHGFPACLWYLTAVLSMECYLLCVSLPGGPLGSLSSRGGPPRSLVDASGRRFLSRGGLLWGVLGPFLAPPERPRAAQKRPRVAPSRPKMKSGAKIKKMVAQRRPQTQNIVKPT